MVTVYVDGYEVNVDSGSTILQACTAVGIEIPRFCYHERLSIAGNCRMCLVEVEKSAKPIASCAMPVLNGMKIFTNTNLVKKAREGVLEFLLVNHPLDCPICDQGGECDLQDQAMIYGSDRGRFYEFKRGVNDKNLGPLIKTIMTRCIHCTRCIRFATEVAGVQDLGTTGRGRDTEVGTYIEKTFDSELSGNVIDICPVGALTSKPYAFTARSWELKSTESVDVLDGVGSNIRIDVRGSEIMRILPRLNEDINEEWISDKTRFSYDGLKRQRLHRPMIRRDGQFNHISWNEAFEQIQALASNKKVAGFTGDLTDLESMMVLKDLVQSLDGEVYSTTISSTLGSDLRLNYLTNTSISGLEDADIVLLLGTNPRLEAPLLNLRLRKSVLLGKTEVYSIGSPGDLTYKISHIGNSLLTLKDIADGNHFVFQALQRAKKPALIIGESFIKHGRPLFGLIHSIAARTNLLQDNWNGLNVLHTSSGSIAALDLGLSSYENAKDLIDVAYILNVDDLEALANIRSKSKYIIYQGHHGDAGASHADLILPGSAYTEKSSTYLNTEGRPQRTKLAFYPPGESREDWKIIRAIAEVLKVPMSYETSEELYGRIYDYAPHLMRVDLIQKADHKINLTELNSTNLKIPPFTYMTQSIDNFYMTNVISRASQVMAKCSKKGTSNYIKPYTK